MSVDFVGFFRVPIFASTKCPRNAAYFDINGSTFMCSETMERSPKCYAICNTLNSQYKNPEHLCHLNAVQNRQGDHIFDLAIGESELLSGLETVKNTGLQDLVGEIEGMVTFLEEAYQQHQAAHEVEEGIFRRVLEIGHHALELFFRLCGTGDQGERISLIQW